MRIRDLWVLGMLGVMWGAVRGLDAREPCTDCHDDVVLTAPHDGEPCDNCHLPKWMKGHPDEVESPMLPACEGCHDEALTDLRTSIHRDEASCQDCHGSVHGPFRSMVDPAVQVEACGECHDLEGYKKNSHGRALYLKGLGKYAPNCVRCHGAHNIRPVDEPVSPVYRDHAPETCGSCHEGIFRVWIRRSQHGIGWKKGDSRVPVCTDCHETHSPKRDLLIQEPWKRVETCGHCHEKRFHTYTGTFHARATELGLVTAATCSDCHTPHENLPASDPRSSVHPDHLKQTCGKCHGNIQASFVSFRIHLDPTRPTRPPAIHWTYLFMQILLLGVFGFFGVHTLLWFQRSLVSLLRKEHRRIPDAPPYVRRFSPFHVGVHLVMLSTFLVLAYTGMTLHFAQEGWARFLASISGGISFLRFLHRMSAVLTFGYALAHLLFLLKRLLLDREFSILWGWKSMVPRWKDFRDLVGMVRWFLYIGPFPRLDRWTYWEKFDYFALFWGIPVIGFSGLMLWFPEQATRFLPGWMLNVAYIVHSEEALLAVGFIVLFHFFHNHLRPENFPMDLSIFTGRIPLERFKRERPEEYQRRVEAGTLEEILVDAPSPCHLRIARTVGWLALVSGLVLMVGILAALWAHRPLG